MIIAIPVFGTQISPRFDCSETFLLIRVISGKIAEQKEIQTHNWRPLEMIKSLQEWNVETLICGGIDHTSMQHLGLTGIRTFSWVTGDAKEAVCCLMNGDLESLVILGNGGKRRGKWRFRGHKNQHAWGTPHAEDHHQTKEVGKMKKRNGAGPPISEQGQKKDQDGGKPGKQGKGSAAGGGKAGMGQGKRRGRGKSQM